MSEDFPAPTTDHEDEAMGADDAASDRCTLGWITVLLLWVLAILAETACSGCTGHGATVPALTPMPYAPAASGDQLLSDG